MIPSIDESAPVSGVLNMKIAICRRARPVLSTYNSSEEVGDQGSWIFYSNIPHNLLLGTTNRPPHAMVSRSLISVADPL